jgi:DNA-binding GntR family transcriptional regulator
MPVGQRRLARPLARDEAYEKLKLWIIDGTLRPGEMLRDQAIAESLGISRTPVREALRRLEDEGFVETALNRWTRVAPLDLKKTIETYGVIEALEVFALDAAKLTNDDLKMMKQANEDMRRALRLKQPAAALHADETFHGVWLRSAHNDELCALIQQLKTQLRRVELAYWERAARTNQSVREHEAILKALQNGSKRLAVAALKRNWGGALQRIQTVAVDEAGSHDV